MLLDQHLGAPLLHACVNLQAFAIGGGLQELGVDFQQRRANDVRGFVQLAPGGHTTLHKKVQR
jgi:hypothetical protein